MSLSPLFAAPAVIQIHAFSALLAFGLGALVLFGRKGTNRHRLLGRIWVGLMLIVALSSLFIWTIRTWGPFSPIHLLSIATLVGLWQAVAAARARQIEVHRRTMQGLYLGALIIAGIFTFLPGRIMHEVMFGADGADTGEVLAFAVGVAALAGLAVMVKRSPRRFSRENRELPCGLHVAGRGWRNGRRRAGRAG